MRPTILSLVSFLAVCFCSYSQEHGFPFGKITYAELDMAIYPADSNAAAVVLNEFGDAYFDLDNLNRIYLVYHTKIKILKEDGKQYGDFEIPLYRRDAREMRIFNIKASTFNRDGNNWKEVPLDLKKMFYEKVDKETTVAKFALPEVRVGSVLEVMYTLETPFTFNFIPWRFQSEIPKLKSEFWAQYPAYYTYNITLKGFLPLTLNKGELINSCVGSNVPGASGADCSLMKFGMENIPAFQEEEFMTAKRNFLAGLHFELEQVTQTDGSVNKLTKEWRDVEVELKEHESFGMQLKRARNIFAERSMALKAETSNAMELVTKIHDYCKTTFTWNGENDNFTEVGVKKLTETYRGNSADLNLSMLGMLLEAGIPAEPILLSTRARGLPIMLHPVISDFNYVLIRVQVDGKYYFLDATSPLNTVGYIPERCLNGKGRALGETSAWIDLKPNDKRRVVSDFKIKVDASGSLAGTAMITHYGYAANTIRTRYFKEQSTDEYVKARAAEWQALETANFKLEQVDDITKPFIEKFEWKLEAENSSTDIMYLPLFLMDRAVKNPFKSKKRFYPVDFGAPEERIYLITLEYPQSLVAEEIPQNIALAMPNAGGRFLFNVQQFPGKITVSCNLSLNKPVYTSEEYQALREIYTRYIALLQSMIVLKKV